MLHSHIYCQIINPVIQICRSRGRQTSCRAEYFLLLLRFSLNPFDELATSVQVSSVICGDLSQPRAKISLLISSAIRASLSSALHSVLCSSLSIQLAMPDFRPINGESTKRMRQIHRHEEIWLKFSNNYARAIVSHFFLLFSPHDVCEIIKCSVKVPNRSRPSNQVPTVKRTFFNSQIHGCRAPLRRCSGESRHFHVIANAEE